MRRAYKRQLLRRSLPSSEMQKGTLQFGAHAVSKYIFCDSVYAFGLMAIYCRNETAGRSKSHATHFKIFTGSCNSIRFDWINKHTSLWLYESLFRSRHVVTCLHQSLTCLQTVEAHGCLFHTCNGCSMSNTAWHLVLTSLARTSLGKHLLILPCQTNRQFLVC
jgi:hypothetical protein